MAKAKVKTSTDILSGSATHLLHRALQIALDYHTEAAGTEGLTQRQFAVLAAAGASEGLTQSDLVRATGIDRSTLADLVARMIRKGLLARERSSTDARANSVRLSEAGRVALAEGSGPAADADQRFLSLLSPKKRETFLKMLASLSEAAPETPAKKAKAAKPEKKKKKKAKKAARVAVAAA
ncbi:MAG TPA: MarR family winged helix-turn-helix transcriptional regulator [Caulobacteraceae bacterium]